MNQEQFITASLALMGVTKFDDPIIEDGEEPNAKFKRVRNLRGSLTLTIEDGKGYHRTSTVGELRDISYGAPGLKLELWPKNGDYSYVYDALSFAIGRQLKYHDKAVAGMRSVVADLETIRKADVDYVELFDVPHPSIEVVLSGGIRLFNVRPNGIHYEVPAQKRPGGKPCVTVNVSNIVIAPMTKRVPCYSTYTSHGMSVFVTEGATFTPHPDPEARPGRGEITAPVYAQVPEEVSA